MKFLKKLIILSVLAAVSFLVIKTHVSAAGEITFTYVSYNTTKLNESDMPSFNPTFDHNPEMPFSTTEKVIETHSVGVEIFHIPNATAPDYSFNGWVYYMNGTEYILRRGDRFYNDVTFYARWTPTPKILSYSLDGGANNLGNPHLYNITKTILLEEPVKTGYSFAGWYLDLNDDEFNYQVTQYKDGFWRNGETVVNEANKENIKLKAKWTVNEYTITFDSNGGSPVDMITLDFGKDITKPANPTKVGYTFAGWYKGYKSGNNIVFQEEFVFTTMPAEDITLYAKWTIDSYTITFNSNGGSEVGLITQTYGSLVTLEEKPGKEGYSFAGWFKDNNTFSEEFIFDENTIMPAEDITLHAKWEANKYIVIFNSNGGEGQMDDQTHIYDKTLKLSKNLFIRENYKFKSWNTEENGSGSNYSDEQEISNLTSVNNKTITLYAQWERNVFTVEFKDFNGHTIELNQFNQGDKVTPLTEANQNVKRIGYKLKGWQIENRETIIDFDIYTVQENVIFKPVYELITYNITYELAGAIGTNPNPTIYTIETETITLEVTGLSKIGHEFNSFEKDGVVITEITKGSIGDITLSLIWTKLKYNVEYITNASTTIATHLQEFDSTLTKPDNPTKPGYEFLGWYKEESLNTSWNFEEDKMPANALTLYAKWIAKNDTLYKVEHHLQESSNNSIYHLNSTITKSGTTNTNVLIDEIKLEFAGYTYDNVTNLDEAISGDGTTVYKLYYKINTYSVTFIDHNDTVLKTENVDYNKAATAPEVPKRTGYTFISWSRDFHHIQEITIIRAQYEINKYTITFELNGGSGINSITQDYGTNINQPTNPTKEGFGFVGWFKDNNTFSEEFIFDENTTMPAENITLYAKWSINSHTITFVTNGGSTITPITKEYNDSISPKPDNPTKKGHTFAGWFSDVELTVSGVIPDNMPAYDITLYAKWNVNEYTISFESNGGTYIDSITAKYDTLITKPNNPTKTGYEFLGWYKEESLNTSWDFETDKVPASTITLYAKWNPKTNTAYTVKHYQQNVTGIDYTLYDTENLTAPTDSSVNAAIKTYEGFIVNETLSVKEGIVKADGTLVLEVYYDREVYIVTFDAKGASTTPAAQEIRYGGKVSKPTIQLNKNGYTFDYWDLDGFEFDFLNAVVTKEITLTAKYNLVLYTITYKNIKDQTHSNPIAYTIESDTIVLGSLTNTASENFIGWYSEETGGNQVINIIKGSTKDKTLYARWETKTFVVSFNSNGGTPNPQQQTVAYGNKVTKPNDPTKTGHTFKYWEIDGKEWNFNEDIIIEPITLYAKWNVNEYTISFESNGGTYIDSITAEYDTLITKPNNPTKTGYEFLGWYKEESLNTSWNFETDKVPASTITLYAKWNAINSNYQVIHYQQKITGQDYTILTTFDLSGLTNSTVQADITEYVGFIVNETLSVKEGIVKADGTLVLEVYYDREVYKVTFIYGLEEEKTKEENVLHQASAIGPTEREVETEGYTFTGWDKGFNEVTSNLTVTAIYTINKYSINFDSNGGSPVNKITLDFGKSISIPNEPTRVGYSFAGWFNDNEFDNPYIFPETMPAYNTNVYAKWELINYNIIYHNSRGAENSNPTTYNIESTFTIENLSLEAYDFVAWYDSETDGSLITEISIGQTEDINLYAKWTAKVYDIAYHNTYNINNPNPVTYTVETGTITLGSLDNRDSHSFAGWYDNPEFTGNAITSIIAGSTGYINLYANWEIKTYTVIFQDYNGVELERQMVNHGSDATLPKEPNREHYTFAGWNKSLTEITKDTTITAQYNKNSYTVTFKNWNGSIITTQSVLYLESATAPADPTRVGYTFTNWDKEFTSITGNLTVTAVYKINTYTVTFKDHDGKTLKTEEVDYGSAATAPNNPTRVGYTFKEWSPKVFTNITKDTTITAQYEIIDYTVTYNLNNGYFKYPNKQTLTTHFINDFNNYFYGLTDLTAETFVNITWNYPSINEFFTYVKKWEWMKTYIIDVAKEQNHGSLANLENGDNATWRYAVHHFINSSDGSSDTRLFTPNFTGDYATGYDYLFEYSTVYNYGNTINLTTPRRNGYVFLGWYDNAQFTGNKITKISPTDIGNKTFYAKWVSELVIATQYGGIDNTGKKIIVSTAVPNQYWYGIGVKKTAGTLLYKYSGKSVNYQGTKDLVITYHGDVTGNYANTLKTIYSEIEEGYYVRIGGAVAESSNINIRFYKH